MSAKKSAALLAILLLAAGAVVTFTFHRPDRLRHRTRVREPVGAAPVEARAKAPKGAPSLALARVDRDLDLFGVVVDAHGEPIAGAEVETYTFPWRRASMGLGGPWYHEERGPKTRAGRDGSFRIRLRRGEHVNVRASAAGHGSTERACCQAGERVRLVLGEGVAIRVLVIDTSGRPVPGAHLHLSKQDQSYPATELLERRANADARGRCVFTDLPPGGWGVLECVAEGYAISWSPTVQFPSSGTREVSLQLREGRTLAGRVVDAMTGAPIPGARVGIGWDLTRRTVTTDASGHYALSGWYSPANFDLTAHAKGYARDTMSVGLRSIVDFRLQRGREAIGRIVGPRGQPVPGAFLSLKARDTSSRFAVCDSARSGSDGRFRFDCAALGLTNTLTVVAEGFGRTLADFDVVDAAGPLDLGDITLSAPHRIEGRVSLPDDSPAPDVIVRLDGANANRSARRDGAPPPDAQGGISEYVRTDDLGRFRFSDLSPGHYKVTADPQGYKPVSREVTVGQAGEITGLELGLAGGHDLTVRLVDSEGNPAQGVSVHAATDGWTFYVQSDAEGVVRFHSGAAFQSVTIFDFDNRYLAPERPWPVPEAKSEMRLVLARAATVTGVVLDMNGDPLPEAAMRVERNGKTLPQMFGSPSSDMEGHFKIYLPADAHVDLFLCGNVIPTAGIADRNLPPFTGQLRDVPAGARDLVLQAAPLVYTKSLNVLVNDSDGRPMQGAQVYARLRGDLVKGANVLTDVSGVATLKDLPDGDVAVYARAVPGKSATRDWIGASAWPVRAEGQTLHLALKRGIRVDGRVIKGEDEPAAQAYVTVYFGSEMLRGTRTDDEGHFTLLIPEDQKMPVSVVAQMWGDASTRLQARRDELGRGQLRGLTLTLEPIK